MDQQNKNKILDNFCQLNLNDKKYLRHSDIDLYINIRLTGVLNYQNLLIEEEHEEISESYSKNLKYSTEVESEKKAIFEDMKKQGKIVSTKNLLQFEIPKYEIYFTVKLVINGTVFEPESITDVILTEQFNEQIIIRYKYKSLPLNSYLNINIYSLQLPKEESLLATTSVNLFDEKVNLIQGKHIFKLHRRNSKMSFKNSILTNVKNFPGVLKDQDYFELDTLINRFYETNNRSIEISGFTGNTNNSEYYNQYLSKLENLLLRSDDAYLEVVLPSFKFPIVYEEEKYPIYKQYYKTLNLKSENVTNNWVVDCELRRGKNILTKDNPITEKFSILSRISDEAFAKDIKPEPKEEARIKELLNTPDFIKLEDSDLILFWKYRYYLLNKKYSLTKILNAVKWGDIKSENEFLHNILDKWNEIEKSDILYMLSFKFSINSIYTKTIHPKMADVRSLAVKKLGKFPKDEIKFILLQLVQALRYEDHSQESPLREFLIKTCQDDVELATSLYWFLSVEADSSDQMGLIFQQILQDFESSIEESVLAQINSQKLLRDKLINISIELGKNKAKTEERQSRLNTMLKKDANLGLLKIDPPLTLPLDPKIKISGTIVENCRVFTSAKYPIKFTFNVCPSSQQYIDREDKSKFDVMYKYGDDLRQDQLILQIISYMDDILRKVNLNFEFTTYKVLATSKNDGFVEFVPNSKTIFEILKNNDKKILPFLKSNVGKKDLNGLLESFINSCAGYCVVTYILGIGDRHLENLLIDNKGRLFHIDFGYILGKDPKLYPPPMKLCGEMVECMRGEKDKEKDFQGYEKFKKKCVDGYLQLRNNARLIVNMFYLMIHCGIKELSENSETMLTKLYEKFVPNMNSEEAAKSLMNKLDESVGAIMDYINERIHAWAVYWK
jgi:phosphatidylinositol 3-kinase